MEHPTSSGTTSTMALATCAERSPSAAWLLRALVPTWWTSKWDTLEPAKWRDANGSIISLEMSQNRYLLFGRWCMGYSRGHRGSSWVIHIMLLDYPKKSMADHGWLRYLLLDSKCSKRRQIASSPSRFPALNPTSFVAPTGKWVVTSADFQGVSRTLWLAKNVFLLFQSPNLMMPVVSWCLEVVVTWYKCNQLDPSSASCFWYKTLTVTTFDHSWIPTVLDGTSFHWNL